MDLREGSAKACAAPLPPGALQLCAQQFCGRAGERQHLLPGTKSLRNRRWILTSAANWERLWISKKGLRNCFLNSDLLVSWETGSVSTKRAREQFGFVCGRKNLRTGCSCWACCCWPKSSCLCSLCCLCSFSSNVGHWAGFCSASNWLGKSVPAPVQKMDAPVQRATWRENLRWKC